MLTSHHYDINFLNKENIMFGYKSPLEILFDFALISTVAYCATQNGRESAIKELQEAFVKDEMERLRAENERLKKGMS